MRMQDHWGEKSSPQSSAARGHEATTVFCMLDCWYQIASQTKLEHVARGAGLQGSATGISVSVSREENNFDGRVDLQNASGCMDSIENGHGNIEHEDIRKQLSSGALGLSPVTYSPNYFATIAR